MLRWIPFEKQKSNKPNVSWNQEFSLVVNLDYASDFDSGKARTAAAG